MKQIRSCLKFLGMVYKINKAYFFVMFFSSLVTASQTIFQAYTISLLIKSVEESDLNGALRLVVLLVLVEMVLLFLNKLSQRWMEVRLEMLQLQINQKIAEQIMSLPFSYLEDPTYMELKKSAEMGINNMGAIWGLCDGSFKLFANLLSLFGLGMILFTFDPVLILILAVGIVFNVLLINISMKSQMRFFHDLLPINFKYSYYMDVLINDRNGKDFRMYPAVFDVLYTKFNEFSKQVSKEFTSLNVEKAVYQTLISTVRYIQMAIVYVLVGVRTILAHLAVSSFSLTVSAALSFSDCISSMIEVSGLFIRSIEYIKPMLELMDIEKEMNKGKLELKSIDSITFDHVTFAYPKTEQAVLEDVSFTIRRNEKISLVGLNGSGKTTIVKLICRLYQPQQGRILVNDIPLEEYDLSSYMSAISTVFQDYKTFAMPIKDNVSVTRSIQEVKELCEGAGVREIVDSLPNKWDSILSKEYDEKGVELSGGQTQKIAIARALAKPADLLILDEPTSALDPIAEAEIYKNFNDLAANRTAIYISHRMSSSIFCDKILVIDGHRVADFDTHENLMKKKDSLYCKLFTTQAENYTL